MSFFFPNRSTEEPAQSSQSLSIEPAAGQSDESSQRSLWLSKRFRGAAYNSFRSSKPVQPPEKASSAHTAEDEIDKMKQRAEKNNMFSYINITSVPFIVSYKGNKDKNIEDVDRIDLILPQFESHDKNWTWLDLSLEIKRLYRNALLSQFMKQKLLRKAIHERAAHSPVANEEEKKRIVLGTPLPPPSTSKKKSKK